MADKRWKAVERVLAKHFGGKRAGPVGRTGPDIVGVPGLSIEVKDRAGLPRWLHDAVTQASSAAPKENVVLVILHEKGMRHVDDFVLMRIRDLDKLLDERR